MTIFIAKQILNKKKCLKDFCKFYAFLNTFLFVLKELLLFHSELKLFTLNIYDSSFSYFSF